MTDHARDDRAREIDTAALRLLCDAATEGPWFAEPMVGRGAWIKGANGHWVALSCGDTDDEARNNAGFIEAVGTALPALLDEIDRLRAENERLRENHEIVARIWRQLGSPTYEQLAGRSIYDLIDELKAKAEPPRLSSKIVSRDIPIITLPEEK